MPRKPMTCPPCCAALLRAEDANQRAILTHAETRRWLAELGLTRRTRLPRAGKVLIVAGPYRGLWRVARHASGGYQIDTLSSVAGGYDVIVSYVPISPKTRRTVMSIAIPHPLYVAAEQADAALSTVLAARGRDRWTLRAEDYDVPEVRAALRAKFAADEAWLAWMRAHRGPDDT